jgi:hypothetical protein
MPERDGYIAGVPCWVDTSQPDPDAAAAFYRGLSAGSSTGGTPTLLLRFEGVPLLGLRHRPQALRDELGQMGVVLEHARDQLRTLGGGHLSHMQRIDDVEEPWESRATTPA